MTKLYAIILVSVVMAVLLMLLARVTRSKTGRRDDGDYQPWMSALGSGADSGHQNHHHHHDSGNGHSDGGAGHGGGGHH